MKSYYFVIKFEKCYYNIELLGLLIIFYGLLRIIFIYLRYIVLWFFNELLLFFLLNYEYD